MFGQLSAMEYTLVGIASSRSVLMVTFFKVYHLGLSGSDRAFIFG
jgi:hypothetical protein